MALALFAPSMHKPAHIAGERRMIGVLSMERPHEQSYLTAFDEHADALFRHACFRVRSRERATDLVQDAFIKAWDYVQEGGEVRHWKSFLYRVLNNLIIDEYRKTREESLDAMLENEPLADNPLLATGGRMETEDRLNDALLIERIRGRIQELPESYRSVLTLRYLDGFSPKEVAQLLDISENVASVRIHRAIARLRELCGSPDTP